MAVVRMNEGVAASTGNEPVVHRDADPPAMSMGSHDVSSADVLDDGLGRVARLPEGGEKRRLEAGGGHPDLAPVEIGLDVDIGIDGPEGAGDGAEAAAAFHAGNVEEVHRSKPRFPEDASVLRLPIMVRSSGFFRGRTDWVPG